MLQMFNDGLISVLLCRVCDHLSLASLSRLHTRNKFFSLINEMILFVLHVYNGKYLMNLLQVLSVFNDQTSNSIISNIEKDLADLLLSAIVNNNDTEEEGVISFLLVARLRFIWFVL